MKQALVESATRLVGPNIFEQGMGKLNLIGAYEIIRGYQPRASVVPALLDLTVGRFALAESFLLDILGSARLLC